MVKKIQKNASDEHKAEQSSAHEEQDIKAVLAEQQKKIDEYTNHLQRLQAEFENYVKRTQKEQQHASEHAIERFITKLLVVIDDFEHALIHIRSEHGSQEEVITGVEMICGKLHKLLAEENIKPIETKGKLFDPHYHEVVLSQDIETVPENTIVEELQKGYTHNNQVIRYAKVKIAKPPKKTIQQN